MEEGHDSWWDRCFANNVSALPRYHYNFWCPDYDQTYRTLLLEKDPAEFAEILECARASQEFLIRLIRDFREEPLYMMLHADHVITDEDLENVEEIDISDYDFTDGNEPKAFELEINRFYRVVCR